MTVYPGGAFTTTQPWLNTVDYTAPQLLIFGIGSAGWVVAYVMTLITLARHRFVEIPAAAVVANIAWEIVWGFVYGCDTGRLFTYGYACWAVLDVFITWNLFRYGEQQVDAPHLKRWFKRMCAFGIVSWMLVFYFFVGEGFDNGYGAISGYIINVMMSALYINLVLRHDGERFSLVVAWSKGLGTGAFSVFNAVRHPEDHFLMALCLITAVLDAAYIVILHRLSARPRARTPSPSMSLGLRHDAELVA
jgi:hypothetical protein